MHRPALLHGLPRRHRPHTAVQLRPRGALLLHPHGAFQRRPLRQLCSAPTPGGVPRREDTPQLRISTLVPLAAAPPPTGWVAGKCAELQEAATHTAAGARLLADDMALSLAIIWRQLLRLGYHPVSAAERAHVLRTALDVARLLPISVLAVTPGAAVTLPLAMRYVPWLIPSSFGKRTANNFLCLPLCLLPFTA